ncbi:MAG: response regulator [Asticcacaulis sp.]|uniref:response regulator n=1 Tax=Asticcacaulis sp. TaxID=1872648 RepID=UPI0039E531ED
MPEKQIKPRPKSVLVVDDDPMVTDYVHLVLGSLGYDVKVADSGLRGLAYIVKYRPDCILLDLSMPDMDGFQFLANRSRIAEAAALPILVLSANHGRDDVQKALKLGAVDYIVKPVTEASLTRRLERFVPAPHFTPTQPSQVEWGNVAQKSLI